MSAAALGTRWAALAPRERQLVGGAAALVALALLWWLAIAPAWRTLAQSGAEHARLDAQLQQMRTLQQRAQTLQAQPRASADDALRALEGSVRQQLAPNAQLAGAGSEGANIALRSVPADTLATWLVQARGNARALPREAHLTRTPAAAALAAGSPADAARARWDGTLVMNLPGR